jgi:hypothetical protein
MAFRNSNLIDGLERQYQYGAIARPSTQGSADNVEINSGPVHISNDQKHIAGDDGQGYDHDDDYNDDTGYTRFVRPSNANGKFFTDRLSQDRFRGIVNILINVSEW